MFLENQPRTVKPADGLIDASDKKELSSNIGLQPGIVAHILEGQGGQCTGREPPERAERMAPELIVGERQRIAPSQTQIVQVIDSDLRLSKGNPIQLWLL